ncbi:MAG: hypothetical protein WD431_02985 [Cyclobacteriaceae bacterium]
MDTPPNFPTLTMPHRGILLLAGIYTIVWGAFFRWFGMAALTWLSMQEGFTLDSTTFYYGTLGMVSGLLIFLSAFYPLTLIYLMGIGGLGKLMGSFWFVFTYLEELGWNKRSAFHLIFNEAIWLIPLAFIFYRAWEVKKFLKKEKSPPDQ